MRRGGVHHHIVVVVGGLFAAMGATAASGVVRGALHNQVLHGRLGRFLLVRLHMMSVDFEKASPSIVILLVCLAHLL